MPVISTGPLPRARVKRLVESLVLRASLAIATRWTSCDKPAQTGDGGLKLHYCEVELQGIVVEQCGEPASVKHDGRWFCEFHYDELLAAEARWAAFGDGAPAGDGD